MAKYIKESGENQGALTFWKKVSQNNLSSTVKLVTFENPELAIKNYQTGVEWFGKHFTLSTQEFGTTFCIILRCKNSSVHYRYFDE